MCPFCNSVHEIVLNSHSRPPENKESEWAVPCPNVARQYNYGEWWRESERGRSLGCSH